MPKTSSNRNIVVTTGDVDGIGLEVTLKALAKCRAQKSMRYFVYRQKKTPSSLKKIELAVIKRFARTQSLQFVFSEKNPAVWVEEAAQFCMKKKYQALVTAPLSKETIFTAGFRDIGHTDILQRVSGAHSVRMAFLGQHFNVLLATGHVAIKDLPQSLTADTLRDTLDLTRQLLTHLPKAKKNKPIALVGLNPHAGEKGIIGSEELSLYVTAIATARQAKINVVGPLVPDAAFFRENWPKYSFYVCPYHDQGLIPFKLVHGQDNGCHITAGLPFVRTSVDHGTAKDIFNKNKANPNSMLDALSWAEQLIG